MKRLTIITTILMMLFPGSKMQAQPPAFYHLSTAEGLSDNNVNYAARDRNGILWIGTTEGLNSFDGYRIETFYKDQHPELAENFIEQVLIDDENRIWLRTATQQLSMLDENRKFHLYTTRDIAGQSRITQLYFTKTRGIIALKGNRHYVWKDKNVNVLEEFRFACDSLLPSTINFISRIDEDKVLLYGNNRLIVIDYSSMQLLLDMPFQNLSGAVAINSHELLAYPLDGKIFYRIDINGQSVTTTYKDFTDQHGKPIEGNLRNITRVDENRFALSTRFSGLYLLDLAKNSLEHWYHDPLDNRSIGGNNTYRINYDSSGYLFVTTQTSGLHYFNMKQPAATSKPYFKEENGEVFDGFIQSIAKAGDGVVWLGAQDRLIIWDRKKDKTNFIRLQLPDGTKLHGVETIRVIFIDEHENTWIGTSRYGIFILDKNKKLIARLTDSIPGAATSLPSNWINSICRDKSGNKWISTLKGITMVEKDSYRIKNLNENPVLSTFSRLPANTIWFDSRNRLWTGTTRGAWCYTNATHSLEQFNTEKGLLHNTILSFNEDDSGNIYIGTVAGLSVIGPQNKITNYNRSNGLRNDRCEDILKDEKGNLWIGNLNCILRFNPVQNIFTVFEEGSGFRHAGFRMRSGYLAADGEMIWGTDKGLVYFFPEQMTQNSPVLQPAVHALRTSDHILHFTGANTLLFPYNESSFTFYFSSGDLSGGNKNQFLYKLTGFDKDWEKPVAVGQVSYNQLPPGNYTFEIKASSDGITWYPSQNAVTIRIGKPWWQQTWFRLLYSLLAILGLFSLYRYYKKRKENRETQQMIDYFANSRYEHSSISDILWDISRNCISRLGFEDCVIYLADEERKVLVQKAAYGPKNPKAFEIANPIEIPFGKGVVGDVAISGKPSIIDDTTLDKRYIVDDETRLSELTVPILHEGKVIGIIDSENRRKNFFSSRHLNLMQTIAGLCSGKISRAIAMEAMKKSRLEVMELNVKMAESKFSNLRLQMNPHFLFNSLSSIQHLIVSQQTTRAYKYLTVFSNFLRSLLNYAEKNFIPLDEELKILQMYIELESLRFDQSFSWEVKMDDHLLNDEVLVPTLMIQPFVENAIWHGLLHKEGEKKLLIHFQNSTEEYLTCTVEDNGIGRAEATRIRQNKITSMVHESKGIGIIRERLKLLEQKTGKPATLEVIDLEDPQQRATGTKVILTIPYYNPEKT